MANKEKEKNFSMSSSDGFKTQKTQEGTSPSKFQRSILQRKDLASHADVTKASTTRTKVAKEEMSQIFRNYMGPVGESDEKLRQDISNFFSRHYDTAGSRSKGDYIDKDTRIKERITALQKRTTETLEALNQCKEVVGSVTIVDSRPVISDDAVSKDKRSLNELTDELQKMQSRAASKSSFATPADRSDVDEISKATKKLLDNLQRISKTYGTLK